MDFDSIIDRRGTDSLKYGRIPARGLSADTLPMWIADMDIKAPDVVIETLVERARHGIFGYSETGEAYIKALADWYDRRFNWSFSPESLVQTPGIVYAIATAIRALTGPEDAVLIQEPVYHCFRETVQDTGRGLLVNELVLRDGRYEIDFDDFERKIHEKHVKLFVLCSPHNPVGRIWSVEELRRMGEMCLENDVIVVSDEIHADFALGEKRHTVFSAALSKFPQNTILCTAPSKTFNIPGLQVSNIFIENPDIRTAFKKELTRTGYSQLNTMGLVACQAAYEKGEPWLEELLEYLRGNIAVVRERLAAWELNIQLIEPEATYLLWLDFRGLGMTARELDHFLLREAKLWLSPGRDFGIGGSGFQRMNVACPRATVMEAVARLERALKTL